MRYAGFWLRFASMLADFVVLAPFIGLQYWLTDHYRMTYVYWPLPSFLFIAWFHLYLVARYGGTPGKLLLGVRIALVDGSPVTLKAAALRSSVQLFLGTLSVVALAMAALAIPEQKYHLLTHLQRSRELRAVAPSWYAFVRVFSTIWMWSELLTMLTNSRRRAVHDFIAGTVVLRGEGPSPLQALIGRGRADAAA